jgi:hypothetical protein
MAGYTKCPDCEGSIPSFTGICEDCGFDLAEFCNEYEDWLDHVDTPAPMEVYAEFQNEIEFVFEHEDPFYDQGEVA